LKKKMISQMKMKKCMPRDNKNCQLETFSQTTILSQIILEVLILLNKHRTNHWMEIVLLIVLLASVSYLERD
jgi:hypothetical protein